MWKTNYPPFEDTYEVRVYEVWPARRWLEPPEEAHAEFTVHQNGADVTAELDRPTLEAVEHHVLALWASPPEVDA